jgi:hypothetical protein
MFILLSGKTMLSEYNLKFIRIISEISYYFFDIIFIFRKDFMVYKDPIYAE